MLVTIEDAFAVAKLLKEKSPKIQSVELFGSVLKNGKGRDLDFIVGVDDDTARNFWAEKSDTRFKLSIKLGLMLRSLKSFAPGLHKTLTQKKIQSRNLRAADLIGIDVVKLGQNYRPGTTIDIWLLPADWHKQQSLNVSALSRITDISDAQNTLLFLSAIAPIVKKLA